MSGAAAVIVAAGRGTRFGGNKLFHPLLGRPLLQWTLEAFESCSSIEAVTLVVNEEGHEAVSALVATMELSRAPLICRGGKERQDSVYRGLQATLPRTLVAVHDGARPLISPELIARCVEAAREHGAAAPAVPVA